MKITIVALDSHTASVARFGIDECKNALKQVEVFKGDILSINADAYVSPANSYGFMDGGIDQRYLQFYGAELQDRVQAMIRGHWDGFMPVGCASMIFTAPLRADLIVAPTMHVPMDVSKTVHAYLSTSAAIGCAKTHGIEHLALPVMCTGVGQMPAHRALRQIIEAIGDHSDDPDDSVDLPHQFESIQDAGAWYRRLSSI